MKKNLFFLIVAFCMIYTINAQTDAKTKTSNVNSPSIVANDAKGITYLLEEHLDLVDNADTIALHQRGFISYYLSNPLGSTRLYAGVTTVFTAYEGTGYLACNYSNTSGAGTIDTWLVSPKLNIAAGDTLSFWERSPDGSTFPDYLMIMYNAAGDSLPSASTWTTLVPAFQTSTAGWFNKLVRFTTNGAPQARFAIRYYVTNGGPSGANSDYVGLDWIQVYRNDGVGLNKNLNSNVDVKLYPNPANNTVSLTLSNLSESKVQINIYNTIGVMVYNQLTQVQNGLPISIDVNNFNAGNYMLQVISNNQIVNKKFAVVK